MSWSNPRGWGGGGYSKEFHTFIYEFYTSWYKTPNKILSIVFCLRGGNTPTGPIPNPFCTQFRQKRYPLRIPFFDKWYPIHIPSIQLPIPLISVVVDALSFKHLINKSLS